MLPIHLEVSKSLARKVNYNINLIIEFFFECCEGLDSEMFLTLSDLIGIEDNY